MPDLLLLDGGAYPMSFVILRIVTSIEDNEGFLPKPDKQQTLVSITTALLLVPDSSVFSYPLLYLVLE